METSKLIVWKLSPALRVILAAVFVYAGVAKLTDLSAFASQVQHFGLGNRVLATTFAHYLPFLEIACGLALLARGTRDGATLLCITLLVMFEGGLGYAWHSGYAGGCGCFGKFFGGANIGTAFVRNLVLLAVAVPLLFSKSPVLRRTAT